MALGTYSGVVGGCRQRSTPCVRFRGLGGTALFHGLDRSTYSIALLIAGRLVARSMRGTLSLAAIVSPGVKCLVLHTNLNRVSFFIGAVEQVELRVTWVPSTWRRSAWSSMRKYLGVTSQLTDTPHAPLRPPPCVAIRPAFRNRGARGATYTHRSPRTRSTAPTIDFRSQPQPCLTDAHFRLALSSDSRVSPAHHSACWPVHAAVLRARYQYLCRAPAGCEGAPRPV